MPTVKVRVSSVDHTTVVSSTGKDLNYVVLKGFDETNNRGFKKQFFATKQDGTTPTVHAQTADTLAPNDWIEIGMDDGKYENVVSIKKIGTPDGSAAPDQAEYKAEHPARTGGPRANPEKESRIARAVALKQAVALVVGKVIKIKDLIVTAVKLEDYLTNGVGQPSIKTDQKAQTPPRDDHSAPAQDPPVQDTPTGSIEDDIPF
jgi:hypothetical protein